MTAMNAGGYPMILKFIAAATLFFLLTPLLAPASGRKTGNDLLRGCNDAIKDDPTISQSINAAYWLGYIEGYLDGYHDETVPNERRVCLPSGGGLETGQIARIAAKYGREHPEVLHKPALVCLSLALEDAFPCPEK